MPPNSRRRPLADRFRGGHPLGVPLLLLAVPLVAVTVSLAAGWRFPVQVGDAAWLTQRVDDVFSTQPPLVGMPSTLGGGELDTHHPGPVQFYWLAPFWTLLGHRGIALGSAAASALALVWIGHTARRLPGSNTVVALGVQVAVAGGALTISPELLADPWNPFGALPWAMLLVVGAARVHSGDARGWPAAAAGATVATQLHAGYLPWVAVLLVVLAVRAVRHGPSRPTGRPALVAAAVVGVLWLPPLIDLVAGIHNPVLLARAALDPGASADSGSTGVLLAASHALSPLHSTLDAVWIAPDLRATELLTLLLTAVAAAVSWWFARSEHWTRPVLAWVGAATLVWLLVAARAPLMDGLLAHSYVRPLWPLGALLWFTILAVWWQRRPALLQRAMWLPVAILTIWAVTIPWGYVGIDPAIRLRGAEIAHAVDDAPAPPEGLTVRAVDATGGIWMAPTVTATLDHRDVPNGIGTDPDLDHPRMSTRPSPREGTGCDWFVGDLSEAPERFPVRFTDPVAPPRILTRSELRRLDVLEGEMVRRFADLEPSRLARHRHEHTGADPVPDEPVEDLVDSGAFRQLVVEGLLEHATPRDDEVVEYLELSGLLRSDLPHTVVSSSGCTP